MKELLENINLSHTIYSKKTDNQIEKNILEQWFERTCKYYKYECDIKNKEDEVSFLKRKILTQLFPYHFLMRSPFFLPNITKAIQILQDAVKDGDKNIVIFCDKDADGLSSASILYLFLTVDLNYNKDKVEILTQKENEKYGISPELVNRLESKNIDIFIALDCASSNKETLNELKDKFENKLNIIIIDHHTLPENEDDFPDADAFINPKILEDHFPEKELCTSAITYKFIQALAFSFTREYNIVYAVKTHNTGNSNFSVEYIKNSIPLNLSETNYDRTIEFSTTHSKTYEGDVLWEQEIKNNFELLTLSKFHDKNKDFLNSTDKFNILQNLRLKKASGLVYKYIPFAAIGTIADIVPLNEDNRIIVSEAIRFINQKPQTLSMGLRELLKALNLWEKPISEQDIAFFLSPAINAPGRLGSPHIVAEAFISKEPLYAAKKAFEIKKLNDDRKTLSSQAVIKLIAAAEKMDKDLPLLVIHDSQIHRGISGSAASQLAENFQKPVVVIVDDFDSLRGSIRAYQKENVLSLLTHIQDIFIQWGGHKYAAGFSLEKKDLETFNERIYKAALEINFSKIEEESDILNFKPTININEGELNHNLWDSFLSFAPYGPLNPHPIISVDLTPPTKIIKMGEDGKHARFTFNDTIQKNTEGVWFFHQNKIDDIKTNEHLRLTAEPHRNYFQNRLKYQLKIKTVDNMP
ncbi:MAG: DHHA1 domain-containing protein [Spirochaetia bacterium]|nr:DHHA1 domain-containing protein [Spirochaetia bacterium]